MGELFLFNLSKSIEFIESGLSDRNYLFYNVPEDTLSAWNSSQGSLVRPSSVEVQKLNELSQVEFWSLEDLSWVSQSELHVLSFCSSQACEEFVMKVGITHWVVFLSQAEVGVWHDLEEETQNTVAELRELLTGSDLALHTVNDVHFQIHKLTVDCVLRWRGEMVLHTVEFAFFDMRIEKCDGVGLQVACFLLFFGCASVESVVESITLFVELESLLRIDLLVVEFESGISESDVDV